MAAVSGRLAAPGLTLRQVKARARKEFFLLESEQPMDQAQSGPLVCLLIPCRVLALSEDAGEAADRHQARVAYGESRRFPHHLCTCRYLTGRTYSSHGAFPSLPLLVAATNPCSCPNPTKLRGLPRSRRLKAQGTKKTQQLRPL